MKKTNYLISLLYVLVAGMFLSCTKNNVHSDYLSTDLKMDLLKGNVEKVECFKITARNNKVVMNSIFLKTYDASGKLLIDACNTEETRYLIDVMYRTDRESTAIEVVRNEHEQIDVIHLASDVESWNCFSYEYNDEGYLVERQASYFEAGCVTDYLFNDSWDLRQENVHYYSHYDDIKTVRVFCEVKYDCYGNWILRKVEEKTNSYDEETIRHRKTTNTYWEYRDIHYRVE